MLPPTSLTTSPAGQLHYLIPSGPSVKPTRPELRKPPTPPTTAVNERKTPTLDPKARPLNEESRMEGGPPLEGGKALSLSASLWGEQQEHYGRSRSLTNPGHTPGVSHTHPAPRPNREAQIGRSEHLRRHVQTAREDAARGIPLLCLSQPDDGRRVRSSPHGGRRARAPPYASDRSPRDDRELSRRRGEIRAIARELHDDHQARSRPTLGGRPPHVVHGTSAERVSPAPETMRPDAAASAQP